MMKIYFTKVLSLVTLLFIATLCTNVSAQEKYHNPNHDKFYEIPQSDRITFGDYIIKELKLDVETAKKFTKFLHEQGFVTYVEQVYSEKVNQSPNKKINNQEYLLGYMTAVKTYYQIYLNTNNLPVENKTTNNQSLALSPLSNVARTSSTMAACTNADFETGNCNGWTLELGTAAGATQTIGGIVYDVPSSVAAASCGDGQHTLVGPGPSCNVPALNNVPPGGGNFALHLGDCSPGYDAPIARQTFTVSNSTTSFIVRYAVVLEDGAHPANEQPYFRIRVLDPSNNPLVCGQFYSHAGSGGDPSFITAGAYSYKNWTTVAIPLQAYITQNITVECLVSDCDQGGHGGDAYIDCSCAPLGVTSSSPAICGGTTITMTAPAGGISYAWTAPAGYTGPTNTQAVTTGVPGNYQIHVQTDASNAACAYDIDTIIPGNPSAPYANFTAPAVCAGGTTQFTSTSTPAASITQYQWDWEDDGTIDLTGNFPNPTHVYPAAGTYHVHLFITWPPCVADTMIIVTVNAGVGPSIVQAGPFCLNAAAVNLSAAPPGGTFSGTGVTAAGLFTPSTVGSPVITYSVGGACPGSATSTIVVNPLPTPTATANTPCLGQALNLTGGPAGQPAANYDWTGPVAYPNTQNPTKAVVANSDAGIYTLTYTDANGCVGTTTVTVTIKPLPTPTAGSNAPCVNAALNLTSGGGPSSVWWGPNGFASAVQSPTINAATAANAGLYHVSVTGANGCVDSTTINIIINPLPVATATSNSPICFGQTLNLTGGPAGQPAANYDWTGPVAYPNTQNPTKAAVALSDGGIYTLNFTDANGCTDTAKVNVVINPLPVPTASSNTPVCFGQTLNLTGGPAAMTSYSWWGPNGYNNGTQSPSITTVTLAAGGTYHISVIDANGCVDSTTTLVVINPLPVIVVTNNGPRCADSTITVNATGGTGFVWWGPNGFASAIQSPSIPLAQVINSGVYHVTVTNANGCVDSSTTTVLVRPLPTANAGADGSMCAGGSVTLVGSGAGAGGSYIWTPAGAGSNVSSYNVSPTANTLYNLLIKDVHGCQDNDVAGVFVNPLPLVNFTVPPVCKGDSSMFVNTSVDTSGGGPLTIFWSYGDGLTANNYTSHHQYINCGTFSTTLIATTDSGCQDVKTHPVLVNCVPTAALTATSVCYPSTTVFTNNSSISDTTGLIYDWDFDYLANTHTTDAVSLSGAPTPTHNYTDGSYVTHLITHTAAGCADSATVNVVVYPKPNAGFTVNSVCLNATTLYTDGSTVNAPDAISQWEWDYDYIAPFSADLTTGVGTGATNVFPNTNVVNTVLIVTTNHGCKDTTSKPITIYPLPIAAFTVAPVCLGVPSVFVNNSSVPTGSITNNDWILDTRTGTPTSTAPNPTYTYPTSDLFPVQLHVTTDHGCVDSVSVNAEVDPNPVVDFIADTTSGCEPLCVNFLDLSTISAVPPGSINSLYAWDFGDGNTGSTSSQAHCYENDGTYDVTLTVTSNHSCTTTLIKPAYITVYPNPIAAFEALPGVTTILDPNVTLIDLSTGGYTIAWNFGDHSNSITYSTENFVHAYVDSGTYEITQVVTTDHGCVDSVKHSVLIGPEFGFYIPNVFTPNADGRNDLFNGKGFGIIKYELLIFNRWGEMIDRIDTLTGGWDGRKFGQGEISQTDVYVWEVRLTDVFSRPHKYIGSVTLLK